MVSCGPENFRIFRMVVSRGKKNNGQICRNLNQVEAVSKLFDIGYHLLLLFPGYSQLMVNRWRYFKKQANRGLLFSGHDLLLFRIAGTS